MKTPTLSSTMTMLVTIFTTLLDRVSAAPVANPSATSIEPISAIEARTEASAPLQRDIPVAELVTREAKAEPEAEAEAEASPEAFVEVATLARTPEDWIIRAREAE